MTGSMICISHDSALHYWRTNPPWYVLEGGDQNIRSLRNTPQNIKGLMAFGVSEYEFGPDPIDILVPYHAPYCGERFRRHTQFAPLPPHSLYPVRDGIHVVSPELCLIQLCQDRDFFEMLELGMELCGTYALREVDDDDGSKRDYCLIDADACRRHFATKLNVNGITLARQVARFLTSGSASPMETKMYLLMCLPQRYGGYNMPVPELNPELPLSYKGQILLRQSSVYPDFLWRNAKLVIEYDGAYHDTPDQQRKDAMRKTVIESEGYTVLQVKRWQLYDPLAFDAVVHTVARIIGKRLRPLSLGQEHARDNLRRRLLPPADRR